MRRSALFLVIAVGGGVACTTSPTDPSSDGGGVVVSPPPAATPFTEDAMRVAHVELNTKLCAAIERCDPVLFAIAYGTSARCIVADASREELALTYGHGTTFTPTDARACAAAIDLSTCDAYVRYRYENIVPEACRIVHFGALALGNVCGASNQCMSGRCLPPIDAPPGSCGRCVARRSVGDPCISDECESGLTCSQATKQRTCRRFAAIEEHCDPGAPCRPHLICVANKCVAPPATTSECEPAVGCAAVPNHQHCSIAKRVCVPAIANMNEPCGWLPDRGVVRCAYGATCSRLRASADELGPPEATPSFVCKERLAPNAACNAGDHPFDSPCETGVCYQQRCRQNAAPQCTPPAVPP